ncbi:MAG: hypothetical protein F4Z02_09650 [Acidimicrobiia bacterium]|nr:hypothetical protein [Acidimicrobiia bacterium]MYG71490.1 hypothetical protein [Acidimicrobiia bacterium]
MLALSVLGAAVITSVAAGQSEHDETMTVASFSETLTASDGFAGDGFGFAVDVDGDVMVVGAYGAAYVFTRTNGRWLETAKLTVENLPPGRSAPTLGRDKVGFPQMEGRAILLGSSGTLFGGFGRSVAVDGDVIVVGAYEAAHVFSLLGGDWVETAKLNGTDDLSMLGPQPDGSRVTARYTDRTFLGGGFGSSVAVDGDVVVISANGVVTSRDVTGGFVGQTYVLPESVYVFERSGDQWSETAKLVRPGEMQALNFGGDVAVDGDLIVAAGSEVAYVYERSGSQWAETAEIVPPVDSASSRFGQAVAVKGRTIIVAAEDFAYMFEQSSDRWVSQQVGRYDEARAGNFGWDVDVDDGLAVIAPRKGTDGYTPETLVFGLFDRPREGWRFTYAEHFLDSTWKPQAVALGGGAIAVGAYRYSYRDVGESIKRPIHEEPGVVRVYRLDVLHPVGNGVAPTATVETAAAPTATPGEPAAEVQPTAIAKPDPTPAVAPTPTAIASATPTVAPTPTATALPNPVATIAPTTAATPVVAAAASPAPVDDNSSDGGTDAAWVWVFIALLVLLVLAVAIFVILRKPDDDAGRYNT